MELGRIVEVVEGDANLFIRRRFLTAIFVCGDVLSFFMQGAGTLYKSMPNPMTSANAFFKAVD